MSGTKTNNKTGFTIVELLIVVVVIAILATISIVAFNGIQDRTHDTAVRSDLANLMKKFEIYKVDEGNYPMSGSSLNSLGARVSKTSYLVGPNTIYNIVPCLRSNGNEVVIAAISKSGNRFYISSETRSVKSFDGSSVWTDAVGYRTPCSDTMPGSAIIPGEAGGGCQAIGFCASWQGWLNN